LGIGAAGVIVDHGLIGLNGERDFA
jgi:hypothetical protein